MKVLCPLPSPSPWSPVGYRVVEVTDERSPVSQPREQPAPPREPERAPAVPCYRVNQVGEETVPQRPRLPRYPRPYVGQRPPKRYNAPLPWVPIALIGLGLAACLVAVVVASGLGGDNRSSWDEVQVKHEPLQVNIPEVQPEEADRRLAVVNLPNLQAGPQEENALPLKVDGPDQPACKPGDRETFGTAVEFVRNPQEAARLAAAERKLTFVLHVSGNFEDAGFT
jgi:hypothetical protein